MSSREFVEAVQRFAWSRPIWRVDVQSTHLPGLASPCACFGLGPPHVAIGRDGSVHLDRDWNAPPSGLGASMGGGVFTIEVIGNFDRGRGRLEGPQLESLITAIDAVHSRFGLPVHALLFHRELPHLETTCPGSGIAKGDILAALIRRRDRSREPIRHRSGTALGA